MGPLARQRRRVRARSRVPQPNGAKVLHVGIEPHQADDDGNAGDARGVYSKTQDDRTEGKFGRGGEGVVRKRSETGGKKDVVAAAETFVRYDHDSR